MADSDSKEIPVVDYIRKETRMNIVINLVLNMAIAYATLRGLTELSRWGEKGYGTDLVITGFILSTILGGIFIAMPRRKRRQKILVPEGDEGQSLAWLIPYNPWLAAPWLGILGAVVAAPLLLGLLALFNVSTLSPLIYSIIKGVWAAALAGIIVPVAIHQGLRSEPPPSQG
jgi:hypothetical protein